MHLKIYVDKPDCAGDTLSYILIRIEVGIGEGGISVMFWSMWNVMLFIAPAINA